MPTSPHSERPTKEKPRFGPVIGITAGELVARYGVWEEEVSLVPADYIHAIADAGGIPLILTPVTGIAEALMERMDGLVLTGGVDVDASLFGAEPHPEAQQPDAVRDRFEIELLDAAVARGLPVLAICRGIQVLNVRRGGTLHQHLPDIVANSDHMAAPAPTANTWCDSTRPAGSAHPRAHRGGRADPPPPGGRPDRRGLVASRGPTTAPSRRSRIRPFHFSSPCSGTPRWATTGRCSRGGSRPPGRPACSTEPDSAPGPSPGSVRRSPRSTPISLASRRSMYPTPAGTASPGGRRRWLPEKRPDELTAPN